MKTLIALHFNASMIKKQMFFNYQRAYAHTHTRTNSHVKKYNQLRKEPGDERGSDIVLKEKAN